MNPSYLRVGGELLRDAILDRVEVTQALNHHWWCEMECHQTEDRRFPFEDLLGKDCQLVTFDVLGEHVVFDGFILKSKLEYKIYGNYSVHLTAVTHSYKMDLTPRQACYSTSSLATIAQELSARSGLSASVNAAEKNSPKQFVQWYETDFSFLNRLADDWGCWMRPSKTGVEVQHEFQKGTSALFRGEYALLSFDVTGELGQPSFDGCHYDPSAMLSRSFKDIKKNAEFTNASGPLVEAVKRESAKLPSGYGTNRARSATLDDYQKRLELESVRAIGSKLTGHGISRVQQLTAGNTVTIEGALDAGGTYGVYRVIHRWTTNGYENEFWCTPWKNWINPEPPPVRRWYGVVPARVVEHSDPSDFGRIRIRFYWQEEGEPMLWARMVTPHAGKDRGFFFMPEVGDEVAVGFEDGDVEQLVVFGSLWNGVDKAPVEDFWGGEYSANEVKRIVTKSGHRIQVVDKPGKESMALATPHSLRMVMLENADETGRSAIVLHSDDGDIFLSAPNGRIHMHSKDLSREVG